MNKLELNEFSNKSSYDFDDLVRLVRILRNPDYGCSWDREQTHESVRHNLVEEAYEVVDAIDATDTDMLCEELGDLLLQVCLHTEMEYEKKTFDIDDVADGICKKLVYRHPHIFADTAVSGTDEILKNWDELKKQEKSQKSLDDTLNGITKALPALMYSKKVQKTLKYGDDAKVAIDQIQTLSSKLTSDVGAEEIGKILFEVVALARANGIDAELSLMEETKKVIKGQRAL